MDKFKKNSNNNEIVEALNGIKIVLILILIVFASYTVIFAVNGNGNGTSSGNVVDNTGEETELPEYDVSEFNEVDYSAFKKLIASKGTHVVYIGRATCGYCAMFIPVMVEAQEKYGFTTNYFDISKVFNFETSAIIDQTTYDEMMEIDSFVKENFLATPMVLVFKNGKYVDGTLGYQEISAYSQFLEGTGFEAK